MLEDKATSLQRDYLREWRKRNPEKVRKYNREYWLRKAIKAKMEASADEHKADQIQDR